MDLSVGFVGYSAACFDIDVAQQLVDQAFATVQTLGTIKEVVSGLTDMGIPALVYRKADQLGLHTVGLSCQAALEYPLYPVDETVIVGKEWNDPHESEALIRRINVLIKIGGGPQSEREFEMARAAGKIVIEFPLARGAY